MSRKSRQGSPPPQAQKPGVLPLQANFSQGLALHQQGRLADAERIYAKVMQRQPNHFDAVLMLGVIALQACPGLAVVARRQQQFLVSNIAIVSPKTAGWMEICI